MGTPDAAELEKSFDEERRRAAEAAENGDNGADGGGGDRVEMVPTIDAQGRLYDVGAGKNEPSADLRPGNRRKKDPVRSPLPLVRFLELTHFYSVFG